jgi:hypothetical protein
MSDFADVQQFALQHAACAGLSPNAQSRPGGDGGYLLTITCACGATHDRWVTAAEARQGLPRPPRAPDSPMARAAAPTPVRAWPARPAPPPPQRAAVVLQPAPRASRGRGVWLVLVAVLVLGAAGAVSVTGIPEQVKGIPDQLASLLGEHVAAPSSPAAAPPPPATVVGAEARPRAAADEITTSLRQLQAAATPSASLNDYASRVAATRLAVERLILDAPEVAQARAQEILDVHRLAVGAWRARTIDDRDEWARVGADPAIDLCPEVKRAADLVAPTAGAPRARARGVAIGASLQPLWECAAEKMAALEPSPAGS